MEERLSSKSGVMNPVESRGALAGLIVKAQRTLPSFWLKQMESGKDIHRDPLNTRKAFTNFALRVAADPVGMARIQTQTATKIMDLWIEMGRRYWGYPPRNVASPAPHDRRFQSPEWTKDIGFDFIKQLYLIFSEQAQEVLKKADQLSEEDAEKVKFYVRQTVDALAPNNFPFLNPAVLNETLNTGGENLLRGFYYWLEDIRRGGGNLAIRMSDMSAFEIGRNVACTPGQVIFQNDLMQLIQYRPATAQVHQRPLLMIPPWINKFYILDLQPSNSLVRWAVEKGHTVFVVSWVNPDAELAKKSFEDYLKQGVLAALDAIERATGERQVNALGYCLGGTLLSIAMAYLAAKGDDRITTGTLLTTLTDFSDPGEIGVFIDEKQIDALERKMRGRGYLEGAEMATSFNMLRENELIWAYIISNYWLGRNPRAVDLLAWNCDWTRMPAEMHAYYLRNMYLRNLLIKPGGLTLGGVPIDLGKVKAPVYMLSTKKDHIAPWKATFAATKLFSGPVKFVLGDSGHIAGVVNPPSAERYGYWTNEDVSADADQWLAGVKSHPGSWWVDWEKWLRPLAGPPVAAREPGAGPLPALEPAPGSFVRVKAY